MLVVNWTYLNLASRRTQDLAETLALRAAVFQLLTTNACRMSRFDQSDDMIDTAPHQHGRYGSIGRKHARGRGQRCR